MLRKFKILLLLMFLMINLGDALKRSDSDSSSSWFRPSNIWSRRKQNREDNPPKMDNKVFDDYMTKALDEFVASDDDPTSKSAVQSMFKTYKPQRRRSVLPSGFRFKKTERIGDDSDISEVESSSLNNDEYDEEAKLRTNLGQILQDYQNDQSWIKPPMLGAQDGSASSLGHYSAISELARGSSPEDSFRLKSNAEYGIAGSGQPTYGSRKKLTSWNGYRTDIDPNERQQMSPSTNRVTFASHNRRSRRNAPKYAPNFYYPPPMQQPYPHYQEQEDCQYHTLINGDSEVILRSILPFRMKGRTILRKCIRPPPHPNDPRYRVLMKGNQKSSFGGLRVSVKM